MQKCNLAKECCVCNVPFCPYDSDDDLLYGDEECMDDDEDEGW